MPTRKVIVDRLGGALAVAEIAFLGGGKLTDREVTDVSEGTEDGREEDKVEAERPTKGEGEQEEEEVDGIELFEGIYTLTLRNFFAED